MVSDDDDDQSPLQDALNKTEKMRGRGVHLGRLLKNIIDLVNLTKRIINISMKIKLEGLLILNNLQSVMHAHSVLMVDFK